MSNRIKLSKENRATLVIAIVLTSVFICKQMIEDSKEREVKTFGPIGEIGTPINKPNEPVRFLDVEGDDYYKSAISNAESGKTMYHYTLDVVKEAEDPEYWEIEKIDDNYYRVRREDWDDDFYGHDEFDCEEYLGDIEQIYDYFQARHRR